MKKSIVRDNKGKIGIYRWVNIISGNSYIGSSTNLGKRIADYYSYGYISDIKKNMLIDKALLKYGYSNFKFEILEYCKKDEVLLREQYYLDLLKPEYNILKKAGSRLGFKHSEATKAKFREIAKNRVITEEEKARVSKIHLYRSKESKEKRLERILELNAKRGHLIEVTNVFTNEKLFTLPSGKQPQS